MTQREISKMLGLSVSTVSLALSDSPRIKQDTRNKVKELALVYGYSPCEIARSLVLNRTNTIGIIIPSFSSPFHTELAAELQKNLKEKSLLGIVLSAWSSEERKEAINVMNRRRVDGLICVSFQLEEILMLRGKNTPFVVYDSPRNLNFELNHVDVDKYGGALMAMEHLVKLGYETIGFVGLTSDDEHRYAGYIESLAKFRLPYKKEWIVKGPTRGRTLYMDGYEGIRKILTGGKLPQAVFCVNDIVAIGAMKAVAKEKLKVPEDIAIVGFDNIEAGKYLPVSLTTVNQPRGKIVKNIAGILMDNLEKDGSRREHSAVKIIPDLVVRESCGYGLRAGAKKKV